MSCPIVDERQLRGGLVAVVVLVVVVVVVAVVTRT